MMMRRLMNALRGKASRWVIAVAVVAGLSSATIAHASWCAQADKFSGHCDVCNALCFLEIWVSGE